VSDEAPQPREAARRKWLGRAVVIGFLVLVAVYVLATFVR
jgi:hypothetical protein